MQPEWYEEHYLRFHPTKCEAYRLKELIKSKFIYLEDSSIEIEGRRIYGSPWTLSYHDWVFQLDPGNDIQQIWDLIPTGVDVLVTHNPPSGSFYFYFYFSSNKSYCYLAVKRLSIGVSGHETGSFLLFSFFFLFLLL